MAALRRAGSLVTLAIAGSLAAGCGGGGGSGGTPNATATTPVTPAEVTRADEGSRSAQPTKARKATAPAPDGARLEVVDSQFGAVVADRLGEALYLFDRERGGKSECYGACAKTWPPLLTRGRPAAAGVRRSLLGTTRRADGKLQVTYAGHPLYHYVGDSPGTILCHDVEEFGGTWLVVKPDGRAAA